MQTDIIIALSTPPSMAALALIRVSGKGCHVIAQQLTGAKFEIRVAKHCRFCDGHEVVDDVVATLWKAPSSYTGEDMVEISCHGNMLIVEKIISLWCDASARHARPGEFTERAFMNGKIDLTQAEAVMDLICAKSDRALRAARHIKEGSLGKILLKHREFLINLLAHLEAHIDFPEEDISPETGKIFSEKILALQKEISKLIGTADEGRKLREGLRVAIVGAPNAGKSTLLNALLGQDRAIVSHIPGTTRDTVEESIMLEGIQLRLIDTAGIRESQDEIEKLGIERTQHAITHADLVIHLIDGTFPRLENLNLPENCTQIDCITKSDLKITYKGDGIKISALTGKGLDELKREMIKKLKLAETPESHELAIINARHEMLLREASAALDTALKNAEKHTPPEIISSDLRYALRSIGEIVGEATNEDILDRLFQTFCIGK